MKDYFELKRHNYEFSKIDGDSEIWVCKDCGAIERRPHTYETKIESHNYEFLKIDGDSEIWVCKDCGAIERRPHTYEEHQIDDEEKSKGMGR